MATEQTPYGPRDTHAERVCLAAGIVHHPWWHDEIRITVEPDDFGHMEHRRIADALDQLYDIGPFLPTGRIDYTLPASCLYWPSSLTVRVWAVATIANIINPAPLFAIARLADGRHDSAAKTVRALAVKRAEILALRYRLSDLTE